MNYSCVLCKKYIRSRESAVKRTIGGQWVHVACAVWTPEVTFREVDRLEGVECLALGSFKDIKVFNCKSHKL
jgi:hypothetical protein